jgi:hypothetical protein
VRVEWLRAYRVFDVKGIDATKRERIALAIEAAARRLSAPHEAWIAVDPFRGSLKCSLPRTVKVFKRLGSSIEASLRGDRDNELFGVALVRLGRGRVGRFLSLGDSSRSGSAR